MASIIVTENNPKHIILLGTDENGREHATYLNKKTMETLDKRICEYTVNSYTLLDNLQFSRFTMGVIFPNWTSNALPKTNIAVPVVKVTGHVPYLDSGKVNILDLTQCDISSVKFHGQSSIIRYDAAVKLVTPDVETPDAESSTNVTDVPSLMLICAHNLRFKLENIVGDGDTIANQLRLRGCAFKCDLCKLTEPSILMSIYDFISYYCCYRCSRNRATPNYKISRIVYKGIPAIEYRRQMYAVLDCIHADIAYIPLVHMQNTPGKQYRTLYKKYCSANPTKKYTRPFTYQQLLNDGAISVTDSSITFNDLLT